MCTCWVCCGRKLRSARAAVIRTQSHQEGNGHGAMNPTSNKAQDSNIPNSYYKSFPIPVVSITP